MTTPFDFKYVKRPMPDIVDEIFSPNVETFITTRNAYHDSIDLQKISRYYETDTTAYFVYEVPRLKRDTIAVSVQPARLRPKAYDIFVEAKQLTINSYTAETDCITLPFKLQLRLAPSQEYALDGSLKLSYSEGVLVVEIPLTKPSEPKKQALSARLSDIDALA